jgi:hypothetical protein
MMAKPKPKASKRAWLTTAGAAKRYGRTPGQISRACKAGQVGKSKRVPVVKLQGTGKAKRRMTRYEWRVDVAAAREFWGNGKA